MAGEAVDPSGESATVRREVEAVLKHQECAWGAGDLESLIATYVPSAEVRYASGAEVIRGVDGIRARYLRAYPDRVAMGHLKFSDVETTVLTPSDALVFGRWTIARETGAVTGLFSLHFRRTADGWRVLSDHTSEA